MVEVERAVALAEKIESRVLEAVLDWGEAINATEASEEGPLKETNQLRARIAGQEVMRLAMGIAKTLRPPKKVF